MSKKENTQIYYTTQYEREKAEIIRKGSYY